MVRVHEAIVVRKAVLPEALDAITEELKALYYCRARYEARITRAEVELQILAQKKQIK
jgi:hypothetical protein